MVGVEERGMGIVVEVVREEIIIGIEENEIEEEIGGLEDRIVELLKGGLKIGDEGEIKEREIWGREENGKEVEIEFKLRKKEKEGIGRKSRGRDNGKGRGEGEVEIIVNGVKSRMVESIGVDSGNKEILDKDSIVEKMRKRRKEVGGKRRVGDEKMVISKIVVVEKIEEGEIGKVWGRGEDEEIGERLKMKWWIVERGENEGELKGDIEVLLIKRKLGRVEEGMKIDREVEKIDSIEWKIKLIGEKEMKDVIKKKMWVGLEREEIVDGEEMNVGEKRLKDGEKDVKENEEKKVDWEEKWNFIII